jgi:hypothetical protein
MHCREALRELGEYILTTGSSSSLNRFNHDPLETVIKRAVEICRVDENSYMDSSTTSSDQKMCHTFVVALDASSADGPPTIISS